MKSPIVVDGISYLHLSDEKLLDLSKNDAEDFNGETITISKQIKEGRGIPSGNDTDITLIAKDSEESNLDTYCEILRTCPCPICNSETDKINAKNIIIINDTKLPFPMIPRSSFGIMVCIKPDKNAPIIMYFPTLKNSVPACVNID